MRTSVLHHQLLLCAGLLGAVLLSPPACANEAETAESCPEGQERDEQEEPACCPSIMMKNTEDGKLCMKSPSSISMSTAATLILSFTFLISLQCFMHHHDVDMREYAYNGISLTVSIYCAVLYFQSLNGIIESFICAPLQKATGWGKIAYLIVYFLHCCISYSITQITIALACCAHKPKSWRESQLAAATSRGHDAQMVMLDVEINSICYGMVSAHFTGFATVKFWTEFQGLDLFKTSPLMTLVPLPVTVVLLLCGEGHNDLWRSFIVSHQGGKDWFEEMWDVKCQRSEDDIMALVLSVMIVNSLRYALNEFHGHRCLPNSEQKEEGPGCEFQHTAAEALWLFACALLFVVLLVLTKLFYSRMQSEVIEEEEQEEDRNTRLISGELTKRTIGETQTKTFCAQLIQRLEDVSLTVWSMAYSWCSFHGSRQLLQALVPDWLGEEENAALLSVVLAFSVTYVAWVLIRIMDVIADLDDRWTPAEVDASLKTVIRGTSIFVGFAWEQTFDVSIDQLAERTRKDYGRHAPAVVKLGIACACMGVVFCSWKWYILPYVYKKGWRFGYVSSKHDLHHICHELAKRDPTFTLDHLHDVARHISKSNPAFKERFAVADDNGTCPNKLETPYSLLDCDDDDDDEDLDFSRSDAQEREIKQNLRSEVKAHRRHARDLEKQLFEKNNAASKELEECKTHQKLLEQQLADERQARLDTQKRYKINGRELSQEQLVNGASSRECSPEQEVSTPDPARQVAGFSLDRSDSPGPKSSSPRKKVSFSASREPISQFAQERSVSASQSPGQASNLKAPLLESIYDVDWSQLPAAPSTKPKRKQVVVYRTKSLTSLARDSSNRQSRPREVKLSVGGRPIDRWTSSSRSGSSSPERLTSPRPPSLLSGPSSPRPPSLLSRAKKLQESIEESTKPMCAEEGKLQGDLLQKNGSRKEVTWQGDPKQDGESATNMVWMGNGYLEAPDCRQIHQGLDKIFIALHELNATPCI